jgi:hypothetical protein
MCPANLAIAVFDNGRYGETGMQASHTDQGVALAGVARACGFAEVSDIAMGARWKPSPAFRRSDRRRPAKTVPVST